MTPLSDVVDTDGPVDEVGSGRGEMRPPPVSYGIAQEASKNSGVSQYVAIRLLGSRMLLMAVR